MSTPDLSTNYLGLELSNPFVASSCPLTGSLDTLHALEDIGAGAVVLPSLFQEQIEHEELEVVRLFETGELSHREAANYFPELESYNTGPGGYMRLIEDARARLSIPVIASLNGISADGWASYAMDVESAGADAIELNVFYLPTDPSESAADVEELYAEEVAAVVASVRIPVSVKIGAHLSAPVAAIRRLVEAGASGVVLFNRFLEPDIDLEAMEVVPRLELSRESEMRLPLRWIGIASASTNASLAATSGVHNSEDAIKLLLAGADVVMVASSLLRHGIAHLGVLRDGLTAWMTEREYESVRQMKGSMNLANCPNPDGYQRVSYMRALVSYS